jgi:hypothetical protein
MDIIFYMMEHADARTFLKLRGLSSQTLKDSDSILQWKYEDRLANLMSGLRLTVTSKSVQRKWRLRMHLEHYNGRAAPVYICGVCGQRVDAIGCCDECAPIDEVCWVPPPAFPWVKTLVGPSIAVLTCIAILRYRTS